MFQSTITMEKRIIFPTVMFVLAGSSFAFGIWQYIYARQVQKVSDQRLARTVKVIQSSGIDGGYKKKIVATVMNTIPATPPMFGVDFSGSFAGQRDDDGCFSIGERAVCRALKVDATDAATMADVCGVCDPKL